MYYHNNKPLPTGRPFTIGEIQYPANWLTLATPQQKSALGIVEVADPARYDERFYWSINNPKALDDVDVVDEEGNPVYVQVYNAETKSMVDTEERLVTRGLKWQWKQQIKDTAGKLLAETDWMVIRKLERSIDIPSDVATKRAAVLTEADRLETAIDSAADIEAFIEVVNNQNWNNE